MVRPVAALGTPGDSFGAPIRPHEVVAGAMLARYPFAAKLFAHLHARRNPVGEAPLKDRFTQAAAYRRVSTASRAALCVHHTTGFAGDIGFSRR